MSLKTVRAALLKAAGLSRFETKSLAGAGRVSYPRKRADQPVETNNPTSEIKATKRGAIHWVGKPGTGGAARALRKTA